MQFARGSAGFGCCDEARLGNLVGRKKSDIAHLGLVKLSDFRKYRRSVLARVGKAKAGFAPAYRAVGGGSLPSWVERHTSPEGSANDVALSPGETDPRITIINFARGAKGIRPAVLARTLQIRANAMNTHIRKQLSLRARENALAS